MKRKAFSKSFWIPSPLSWGLAAAGMTMAASLFFTSQAKADATTTVRLMIKTSGASLYDADIGVTACADAQSASTTSINALCALTQSGVANNYGWFGDTVFVNSIGGYANNAAGNGIYWGWFENLNYSNLALNQYILKPGDKILLAYDINPLRISASNLTPDVNASSTITLKQFGLDSSWNPAWAAAGTSTLVIDGAEHNNSSGIYDYLTATSGPHVIYGKKAGYLDSDPITVTVKEVEADNPASSQPVGGSVIIIPFSSGGGASPAPLLRVDFVKAVDYLYSKQAADGSFGSAIISDWAAAALASVNPNGPEAQKLKNYLLADPNPLAGLNPVSDYSRRSLALMSLNLNPYNSVKTNYIKKIVEKFDGQQFGDASLYNDDIFALLVLNKAGYGPEETVIANPASFVLSKQQSDGSWGGADLTAAAIQALKPLSAISGVGEALNKAKAYLKTAQKDDGGFGNGFTTPWVMQAVAALGESAADWKKNNLNPESSLVAGQGADGGLEKDNPLEANRIWATAYALPAIQDKPWFNLMSGFAKENIVAANEPSANLSLENLTATSTPELDRATTTADIWPEPEETASSNDESIGPKVLAEKIVASGTPPVIEPIIRSRVSQQVKKIAAVEPKEPKTETVEADKAEPPTPAANPSFKSKLTSAFKTVYSSLAAILKLLRGLL